MPSAPVPRKILIPFAMVTSALWGLAVAAAFDWPDDATVVLAAAAVTCTVTGAVGWAVLALRDRDKELLIRGLVEASQRAAKAKTTPLRRVK